MPTPKSPRRARPTDFSAFIDLVGTRYYAQQSLLDPEFGDRYWDTRDKFHYAVGELSLGLKAGKVFLFSDCAYIESSDFRSLCTFLAEVRTTLAKDGLYFKGAVAAGRLEHKAATDLATLKPETRNRLKDVLQGYYFGRLAGTLYGAEESLKGIGVSVVGHGIDQDVLDEITVKSCYAPADGSHELRAYDDIRFTDEVYKPEIGDQIIERTLREFAVAKSHSRKIGRLFVSFLVTFIQGADPRDFGDKGKPADTFRRILLGADFERLFGGVVGIQALYYALLLRLSKPAPGPQKRVFEAVKAFIAGRPSLLKKMDLMPTAFLPSSTREQCLGDLSESLLHGPAKLEGAKSRIEELLREGHDVKEIVRRLQADPNILNPRGFGSRGGRQWKDADVRWFIRQFDLTAK